VIEENKRSRVDANAEAKEKRRQWREKQEELKKEAAERGLDPERAKLLNTTAANAERQTRAQGDKKYFEWDMFNDDAQFRHHKKLVNKSLPNAKKPRTAAAADDDNDDNNAADDDALTATAAAHISAAQADDADAAVALDPAQNASLGRSSVPREQALNRLVDTLHASAEKRAQFSRRRTEHEEADVDYINSKNKIFNKKIAKAYDAYSVEIRQNLERGSAI
jgi:pre-mRNA-splicing factor SYF2